VSWFFVRILGLVSRRDLFLIFIHNKPPLIPFNSVKQSHVFSLFRKIGSVCQYIGSFQELFIKRS
jgi:hypothetical protein